MTGKGGVMEGHQRLMGATHNDEIRIAIGTRIYVLFCADCNRTFMAEDEPCQRIECPECKRLYAYRMQADQEEAFVEFCMLEEKTH